MINCIIFITVYTIDNIETELLIIMLTIYFLQVVCDHSSHIFMSKMLVQSMTLVFFVHQLFKNISIIWTQWRA